MKDHVGKYQDFWQKCHKISQKSGKPAKYFFIDVEMALWTEWDFQGLCLVPGAISRSVGWVYFIRQRHNLFYKSECPLFYFSVPRMSSLFYLIGPGVQIILFLSPACGHFIFYFLSPSVQIFFTLPYVASFYS